MLSEEIIALIAMMVFQSQSLIYMVTTVLPYHQTAYRRLSANQRLRKVRNDSLAEAQV